MNVPPYVPQPIEIPENVAEERYAVRLGFIRRVVALYVVSIAGVVGASFTLTTGPLIDTAIILASLLLLSLTRELAKGRFVEQRISLLAAPSLLLGLGMLIHWLWTQNWPVWSLAAAPVCAVAYTMSCGRDLSFMGMWVLTALGTVVIITAGCYVTHTGLGFTLEALLVGLAYLSYFVYDLAALLTRRRVGEEVGAVLDLYRDVLNMFSYPIRVWRHWREHRIWSRP